MIPFFIGALFMLTTGYLAGVINKKATGKLEENKKNKLVNLFKNINFYLMIVFGFFFVIVIVNLKFEWIGTSIAENIVSVFCGLWFIAAAYLPIGKLRNYNFPYSYIKMYLLSSFIRTLGLILPIYFITHYHDIFN